MPNYCVNKNAQSDGYDEVHDTDSCTHLPDWHNRESLGWHADCKAAVKKAKDTYSKSDGCAHCSSACHTR